MKRSTFDSTRDQRIAEDASAERALMCCATGCPNRWSVNYGDGKFCRFHAWQPANRWPAITQEQLDAQAERAYQQTLPAPEQPQVDKRAILDRLLRLADRLRSQDPKAWARRLQAREEAGERLTPAQREMWRDALRYEQQGSAE